MVTRALVGLVFLALAALVSLGWMCQDAPAEGRPARGMPGAGMWLETAGFLVTDEAAPLHKLARVPDKAAWAVVRNTAGITLYLGTRADITLEDGWPITPGEEVSFSLAAPVYLKSPSGDISVRVLFGR